MYLQLDTTVIFKQAYDCIVKKEKESDRKYYLTNTYYDHTSLAELCGYIGDKRFVQPLEEALGKSDNFRREIVLEALARMRADPYYSNYIKERTLTTEQIHNNDRLQFSLDDFVYVWGTQEAFLELSKYLLSNKPYRIYTGYHVSYKFPVSDDAFSLIRDYIENESLQTLIKTTEDDKQAVYEWMQKNYGKYKIRRIW
jgi:hypothetical protein